MRETADQFAERLHRGQVRKYTGDPYIVHPRAVRALVEQVPHTQAMLDAAVLHDTVEDTTATLDDILRGFGGEVMALVSDLTDVSKPEDGNRAVRKEIDRQHTAQASAQSKTIKLADLIDNTHSIVLHDPNFAQVYLKEKALLLEVLKDGDQTMYNMAVGILVWANSELGVVA